MLRNSSILIVDDDPGLARLIEKLLRREGYATAIALSGSEAIQWSGNNKADLLLIDLKLPDIPANDLIGRLAAGEEAPPFIIITGEGDERVAVEMMKRGALDYLVKDSQFLDLVPIVVKRTLSHLARSRLLLEAELRLKKEHAFSDAVLDTSGALMLVVNADGQIVRFNRACELLTGYTFDKVQGSTFWETFISESARDQSREGLDDIIRDPRPKLRERQILCKDGRKRLISWSVTTLPSEDGSCAEFIIASGMDITEQRQLEARLLEAGETEQKRIGQDLHDGLCQLLAGIDMMATVLKKKLSLNSPENVEAASGICHYTREAIEQARLLARGLSPVELEINGLMSALQELAASTRKLFKVECSFVCHAPVLIADNSRATHLYRIAQESINNAFRHGHAKSIVISLEAGPETAVLSITDDGEGFDTGKKPGSGMGLKSMGYRATVIGGNLDVSKSSPKGMVVRCTFPLPPDNLPQASP